MKLKSAEEELGPALLAVEALKNEVANLKTQHASLNAAQVASISAAMKHRDDIHDSNTAVLESKKHLSLMKRENEKVSLQHTTELTQMQKQRDEALQKVKKLEETKIMLLEERAEQQQNQPNGDGDTNPAPIQVMDYPNAEGRATGDQILAAGLELRRKMLAGQQEAGGE